MVHAMRVFLRLCETSYIFWRAWRVQDPYLATQSWLGSYLTTLYQF